MEMILKSWKVMEMIKKFWEMIREQIKVIRKNRNKVKKEISYILNYRPKILSKILKVV